MSRTVRLLAFWSFPQPRDDDDALARYQALGGDRRGEQDAHLLAFVAEVTARYPDLDENGGGVWTDGPLAGNVVGSLLQLGVRARVDEVVTFLIDRALAYHLNVFDVKEYRLL